MKYAAISALITIVSAASLSCRDFEDVSMEKIKNEEVKMGTVAYSAVPAEEKTGERAMPAEMTAAEAFNFILEKNPVVIDVRTPEEYAAGRLEKARLNIDYYAPDFREKLAALDRNAEYLIYCRTGKRSAKSLEIMKELGFTGAGHILGGITAWQQAGYPVVKTGKTGK